MEMFLVESYFFFTTRCPNRTPNQTRAPLLPNPSGTWDTLRILSAAISPNTLRETRDCTLRDASPPLRSVKCKSSTCTWRPDPKTICAYPSHNDAENARDLDCQDFRNESYRRRLSPSLFRQSGEIALYMGDDINGGLHANACLEIDKPNVRRDALLQSLLG